MSGMTDDSTVGQPTADYAHFYARPPPSNVDQEAAAVPPLELNVSTDRLCRHSIRSKATCLQASHDSQAATRHLNDVQRHSPLPDKQTNLSAARLRSSRNSESQASVGSGRRSVTNQSSSGRK